jgi:hypothetical protein
MPRVNIELVAGTQQFELAMRKSQSEVAKLAAGIAQADARISKANATIAKASAVIATSDASAAKANATIASLGTSAERTSVQLNAMGAAGTKAGLHMVSGMQASSAAIRVMEGGMTNNCAPWNGLFPARWDWGRFSKRYSQWWAHWRSPD